MPKKNFKKASALVATMMILGIMLITALSVSLVSLKERKAAMSGSKSGQAFQNAQSGVELVMQAVMNGGYARVSDINIAGAACDGVTGLISDPSIPYTVELRDANDAKIDCDRSDVDISAIASIKSIGSGGGSQRAIQAAVAAGNVVIIGADDTDSGGTPFQGRTGTQACASIGKTCVRTFSYNFIRDDADCAAAGFLHCMRVCATWYNQSLPGVVNVVDVNKGQDNIHSCDAFLGQYTTYLHVGVVRCNAFFSAVCN